tara:strand:- start:16704 stop:17450 length:747 start_codon:yes stop_codon:yes gene_type:complete
MHRILYILLFLGTISVSSQDIDKHFQGGEELKYRIHYGIVNAGYATLAVSEKNGEYHFVGKGWTIGITNLFFKVRDQYESHVDKNTLLPNHFVRRVNEGGYRINRDVYFDHEQDSARVEDHKLNTTKKYPTVGVQDLISSFYTMRNTKIDTMSVGSSISLNIFIDGEMFPFKLVLLGNELVSSKYGKIPCYKFRPFVQKGRIFKENESLTIWISADKNKIPIRIKASLAVGSAKIDLTSYKGLTHSFP